MADINTIKNSLLNQLASEIIVLDKDLNIVWMNDSATSNGWVFNSVKASIITEQLSDETSKELTKLLVDCISTGASVTKRGFKLSKSSEKNRIVDLTVSWSGNDNVLIMELLCIDNLNKIIDSSKIFSTQKIAANLARTLAHEVKNPLSGIKGSAQILSSKIFSTQKIAANLARTLAHEVKNPLSGIKGSAQILSSKLSDDFSKKFLKIIIDETERLNNIVTKILTPPKKPKLELFNIHSALEKVFALSQVDKDDGLTLKRDYDPSIPEIYGDEDLFIQAILNIVKNAQQALSLTNNPAITIKSRVSYSQPINGNLHSTICDVSIIDNGPGIPTDIQEQVFFPMVSSKEDGSGLGLSISQDIIRIHGGAISFKTKSGETAFSIQIPIKLNSGAQSA